MINPAPDDPKDESAVDDKVPIDESFGRLRAGYNRTPLLVHLMPEVYRFAWLPVNVDEPRPITGIWAWWNRRLSDRLWKELTRIGAIKDYGSDAIVEVAGEARLGFAPPGSPKFLIGSWDLSCLCRILILSGTRNHVGRMWSGPPNRLFRILAGLPTGAGADKFWQAVSADEGYSWQNPDEKQNIAY